MPENAIETRLLRKTFGDFTAVADIDLQVPSGEVFGFLGPNGAGKTTTIGMLLGLIHASGGEMTVLGESVSPSNTEVLKRVGALMGAPAYLPYLSAENNLKLVAKLYPDVGQKRIDEVLELVNLTHAGKRKATHFSTGMKQRLGLAAALLHRPKLVILDEPGSGLDPNGQREFRDLMRYLVDEGVSVFLSSHILSQVQQVCDRVAVLNAGKIVAYDTVEALLLTNDHVQVVVREVDSAETALSTIPNTTITVDGNAINVKGADTETVLGKLFAAQIVPTGVAQQNNNLEDLFASLTV